MYKNNVLVTIKSAGHPLREVDGEVYIPFNSQYYVQVYNKKENQAINASMYIDGELIKSNLLILPGQRKTIHSFPSGNAFLFKKVEGKTKNEKAGEIRVVIADWAYSDSSYTRNPCITYIPCNNARIHSINSFPTWSNTGITVKGPPTGGDYSYFYSCECLDTTFRFKLVGLSPDSKPVTTKHKPYCTKCGKKVEWKYKFCPECGHEREKKAKEDTCEKCGHKIKKSYMYCPICGYFLSHNVASENDSLHDLLEKVASQKAEIKAGRKVKQINWKEEQQELESFLAKSKAGLNTPINVYKEIGEKFKIFKGVV